MSSARVSRPPHSGQFKTFRFSADSVVCVPKLDILPPFRGFQRYFLNLSIASVARALSAFRWTTVEGHGIFYFPSADLFRGRTLNQIGEPSKPNAARI